MFLLRHRLARDRRGVALLEFGFAMPIVIGIGCYGVELCNLALLNHKVSQIALNLADNASRVSTYSSLSTQQLREEHSGRVRRRARAGQGDDGTATSIAGSTSDASNAGTAADGLGDAGAKVIAPASSGVMCVEINFESEPLFGGWLIAPTKLHYIASFIVRDRRDLARCSTRTRSSSPPPTS